MRIAPASPGRIIRLALALFLVLAGVLGAGGAAAQSGPPFTPPGVDHYLVYPVLNPPIMSIPVRLSDQFGQNVDHQTIALTYFMTPVNKQGEGIIDPIAHYTWWEITPNNLHGYALISNQFGPNQPIEIFDSRFLLNPALKNMAGIPLPVKNHYKVYNDRGPAPGRIVDLVDQFFPYVAEVDSMRFLAVPAEKYLPTTGQDFPILDPIGHLAVYQLKLQTFPPPPPPVVAQDEFGVWQLVLGPPVYLCVPSYKNGVTPTKVKTWSELKKVYQ